MDREKIKRFAQLLVTKGINPSPGQAVIITASPEEYEFVRMTAELCYQAGAGRVILDWADQPLARLAQEFQSEENLSQLMPWERARWQWMTEELPCRLLIHSEDPDGMSGLDAGKLARTLGARLKEIKPFRAKMENRYQWCIGAIPGKKWAQKVFPGIPAEEAVEKLWAAILTASRADGDPIANWEEHNRTIHARCEKINSFHFRSLRYQSANGTDFTVGLMEQGIFAGAAETDLSGREFNPNIPSEEIFTSPRRGEAEGLLVATKPLSWQGALIENFSIRFENGKAVEVHAEKGQEALEKMIAIDEGAAYLGECALVAYDSPINNTGILFYTTLFDENACCHMALGRGFDVCVQDFDKYSQDELHEMGLNDSAIHVDFMIGSEDLSITGVTADGKEIPIFRNGGWTL